MKRQRKRGQRQHQDWEETRGSSQDCGCCFIKFIVSPGSFLHSKIHYYIRQSMGNFPKSTHRHRVSRLSLMLSAEIYITGWASLEHNTLCLCWQKEITMCWEQSGLRCYYSALIASCKNFIGAKYQHIFSICIVRTGDNTVAWTLKNSYARKTAVN